MLLERVVYVKRSWCVGVVLDAGRWARLIFSELAYYIIDFTVDEGGSAEPARDKNIIGMYHRRRGSNPPLLCDPGWVV